MEDRENTEQQKGRVQELRSSELLSTKCRLEFGFFTVRTEAGRILFSMDASQEFELGEMVMKIGTELRAIEKQGR